MSRERVRSKMDEQQAARISTEANSEAPAREMGGEPLSDLSGAQQAVLGLQRTQGNAAVRRLLARRGATAQREVQIDELAVNTTASDPTNSDPANAVDPGNASAQPALDFMIRNHPTVQMPSQMDVTFDGGVSVVADAKVKS